MTIHFGAISSQRLVILLYFKYSKWIFQTAVDWTQLQFYEFLQNFVRVTGLHFRTEAFLLDEFETDKEEELILRNYIRPLFLENCNVIGIDSHYKGKAQELHFRVTALLNMFSMRSSSSHRFILLLGAPINVDDDGQSNKFNASKLIYFL